MADDTPEPRHCRAIWISDVHLGVRDCQAGRLLDFMRHHESDHLYLVGDIFDGWQLRRSWYWRQEFNDVIQKILRRARKGCRVVYVPGNHDAFVRDYVGHHFGGIEVCRQAEHVAADGRRLLVTHGDEFDSIVTSAAWLARLGSLAYQYALLMNRWVNAARRVFGFPYWSLSAWLKFKVKNAVLYIDRFERLVTEEARRRHAHGVVCGHIHHATIRDVDGMSYYNTGDWIESSSAVVEHHDGRFEVITWPHERPEPTTDTDATESVPNRAATASQTPSGKG
jgi:UDP-2,3-diacylglucosamine pyrophosphatase LpxH